MKPKEPTNLAGLIEYCKFYYTFHSSRGENDSAIDYKNIRIYLERIVDGLAKQLQEIGKFPRLGNYPHDATKKELVEYVEELTDWASDIEDTLFKAGVGVSLPQPKTEEK